LIVYVTMVQEQNAKIIDSEYNDNHSGGDYDTDTDTRAEADVAAPYSVLPTDEDRETIIDDALDELADIARENILEFKREDFDTEEVVGTWIDSYLCQLFEELTPVRSNFSSATAAEADALNEVLEVYIQELYNEIFERFYEEIAPSRSDESESYCVIESTDSTSGVVTEMMTRKLQILREKPQPDQRTPEWYARRNNLITASAASKAFGSQASVNQLIYEKCKNYSAAAGTDTTSAGPLQGSVNSPLHWGQRYEPVTVMVYEYRNKTRLGEFGCIQHDNYPFIGASPDGINVDPASPIYGRMVEIKNIFNREITGSPKEEYWIQTQIQMEVCDLDECDFVETRFKEYDSEAEYLADTNGVSGYTSSGNEKGRILWFQTAPALTNQGYVSQPIQLYEYAPIGVTTGDEEYAEWEAAVFAKHECARNIWVRTIYWYLDEYSCVLVHRNRLWFSEAVKVLEKVWATIEEERETGYEHRAPKKKPAGSPSAINADGGGGGGGGGELKIIKLECAIVPTETAADTAAAPATATNMATLMAINNHMAQTNKKYSGGARHHVAKGPSEVLINCFKINDLEIDENKV
jgi:putative phage-type endonuclease